jgi:hypothetical protein
LSGQTIFPLLCFADKALVVGDPKQLPPIITMDGNTKIQYEHQYGEDTNALMYSPATVSAYHRASSAKTGHHNDIGNSIILEEHRRCQPPIAEAFVEIAEYVGMKIETQPLDLTTKETQPFVNMGGKPFLFYDVVGRSKSRNTNLNEADTIVSVVKKLLEAGYSYQDIGIITPYAAQESLLKRRLSKEDLQNKIQVGTIHKFQGVEFNVILFSSVIFLPEHSSFFINSAPNMLNVALSRAKQLFVVVGCLNKLQKSSGFLEIMCRHILENGEVYEVMPPDTHSKPKNIDIKPEVGIEIIDDTCRHLTIVEESYAKVKKELIIVSPWIREYSRKDYSNFQRIKKVVADGINVKVFYGYVGEKFGGDASKYEETTDQKLVQQFKTVLGKNLVRLSAGTHEKVLIVDRKEMYIGSFNWLSNQYPSACKRYDKGLIRRESTTKILDQNTIQRYVGALLSTTSRK